MSDKTNDAMKEVAIKAEECLGALELVNLEVGSQELKELIDKPINLRDTSRFNIAITMPTQADLQEARRELAGAIATERWLDGFRTALGVLAMFG